MEAEIPRTSAIQAQPTLFFKLEDKNLMWQFRDSAAQSEFVVVPFEDCFRDDSEIRYDLLRTLHPILYDLLPASELSITWSPELENHPKFQEIIGWALFVLKETQEFLKANLHLKHNAQNYDNVLFYEINHSDFHSLYLLAKELAPSKVIHAEGQLGFNPLTRDWEPDLNKLFSLDELIERIRNERIRRIAIPNMYYAEIIARTGVYLPAVMNFLGVELIYVDFDLYDQSYAHKASLHCNNFQRFSVYEHHQRVWDEIYGLKNVSYLPTGFVRHPHTKISQLHEDYGIAIASHARSADVKKMLPRLIQIMEALDPHRLIPEFQLWYYSFRHWIMNQSDVPLFLKAFAYKVLYHFYLTGISLLKYETIASLKSDRPILLFGDQAWANLFPQYYQGKYLDNYESFYSEGRHINLLLNANFSYLENNPVFSRALKLGAPFLCFPAVARSLEFDGMKVLEYQNADELNSKIESINTLTEDLNLLKSKAHVEDLLRDGTEHAARKIMSQHIDLDEVGKRYQEQSRSEINNAIQIYEQYIQRNASQFESMFNVVFSSRIPELNVETSRFAERDYIQRLLAFES